MKIVRHNHFILFLLAFLFAAPGISAYFLYFHPDWLGDATTNKGQLLNPPVLFTDLDKRNSCKQFDHPHDSSTPVCAEKRIENQRLSSRMIKLPISPKWQMLLWSPNACEQSCKVELDKLARIRLALGRHLYEVEPKLLLGPDASQLSEKLVNVLHDQGIHIRKLSVSERARMTILREKLAIFIVDPDDYLVLSYEASVKPEDIFHDIKQLLK